MFDHPLQATERGATYSHYPTRWGAWASLSRLGLAKNGGQKEEAGADVTKLAHRASSHQNFSGSFSEFPVQSFVHIFMIRICPASVKRTARAMLGN
jgi:hypothetical protein